MARQRKARRLETLQIVTRFATVLVGEIRKLALVNILMTVLTHCLRDFKKSVFTLRTLWHVTLVASDGQMAAFKRVFCRCMILDGKSRRLPPIYGMACGAFTAIGASPKLPLVRILVTVHAFRKRHGRLEVPMCVAVAACNGRMFAQQRKLCL